MELTFFAVITVALIALPSPVAPEQMCGSETCYGKTECRTVRVCSADDTSCSLQPKCVAKSLILNRQACPNGQHAVLRAVGVNFFTHVTCDKCMGDNSQCYNDVCCSALPAGRSDVDEGTTHQCRPACRMGCKYGMETDSQGCPLCSCRDPCRNVACPRDWRCKVTGAEDCRGPVCHGLGASCVLEDACTDVVCPGGRKCVPCTDRDCPSAGYTCQADRCSGVTCRKLCQFGRVLDRNGCDMCQCAKNPCDNKVCPQHEMCRVESTPCYTGTCYNARCVPGPKTDKCPPVMCRMHCPFGWDRDQLTGCEVCKCKRFPDENSNLCDDPNTPECPAGTRCEMKEVQCFRPPCLAVPVCLVSPATNTPPPPESRSDKSCPEPELQDWNERWCNRDDPPCSRGTTCCQGFIPGIRVCKAPRRAASTRLLR